MAREISKEQRKRVKDMAAIRCTQEEIAAIEGMARETLRTHFAVELEEGAAIGALYVKKRLRDLINDGEPSAIFFYLKTQCGWRETSRTEITGPGGEALAPGVVLANPLTEAQWLELYGAKDSMGPPEGPTESSD